MMQFWRWAPLLLLTWLVAIRAWSQSAPLSFTQPAYIFHHLDNNQGLLSNEVSAITQDPKGYMWIGTNKGLQRYDGLRFINFEDAGQRPVISSLHPDPEHQRLLFNFRDNEIRQWQFLRNQPSGLLSSDELDATKAIAYADHTGRWLVQPYITDRSVNNGQITQGVAIIKSPVDPMPRFCTFIKDVRLQQLWIRDDTFGLLLFREPDHTRITASTQFNGNQLLQLIHSTPIMIRNILMDSKRNIWIITWSPEFYRYSTTDNILHSYSLADIKRKQGAAHPREGWANTVLEDNHGRIWIGTAGAGLLLYDAQKDDLDYILHQPGNDLSIRYNYEIVSLHQDREENIWIGTDRGINVFNPYKQFFSSLGNPSPTGKAVPGSEITGVMPWRDGRLLVSTWGSGLFICNAQLGVERSIYYSDNRDKSLTWCLQNDDEGNTWVGCQHGYLHILDSMGRALRTLHDPIFEHKTIRCMTKDPNGNILFGLHNGKIITWDKTLKKFLPLEGLEQQGTALSPVITLGTVRNGMCYAGTANGLASFDTRTRQFTGVYSPDRQSSTCLSIADLNDSIVLAGFEFKGLYFFNRHTKALTKVPVDYGQPMWSVNAISKDQAGHIWFTTEYDVCKYDPVQRSLQVFHPDKGLLSSPFEKGMLVQLPNGRNITWTSTEVVTFSPPDINQVVASSLSPIITGLKVFDRPVAIDSLLLFHAPLRLSYKENFISIQYSNLQFAGITDVAYYYRLKGVDHDWVAAGGKGEAGYTNLPPGTYTFEVKTGISDSHGNTASFEIEIMAPFWQTTWFRIASLVLLGGLVFSLIYWRFRHLQSQAVLKEKIAKTEMMALRAQMNPHFIFNCINGIDALILSDDKYQATMYLNKFAMLIRNILDSSKENTVSLGKDLETLRLYIELEQWRHENRFTAEIITGSSVYDQEYKVPPLVIQPYVENAILHGLRHRRDSDGKLTIELYRKDDRLIYIVEDNGVGRSAIRTDKQHQSYGMEINLGRLKLFNQQEEMPVVITDLMRDGLPVGTRVEVHVKIQ